MPEVRKSGGLIGAEVCGLDLTRQYPDETYQAILRGPSTGSSSCATSI